MRSFFTILFLLCLFQGKAWAIQEIKLVRGAVTLPSEHPTLYKVSGEVELLWDVLATPEEFEAQKAQARLSPFPALWSSQESDTTQRQGRATYRLTIHLSEASIGVPLGLRLPRTYGPSTIWLNNQIVVQHDFGPDGSNLLDRSPGHNRIYFTPHQPSIELVIQTFNWHLHTGGFSDRFLIGHATEIQSTSLMLMAFDFLVFGLLVFSAVYHLWLFTFRRKFNAYRDLGLFFFFIIVRILCTGSSHWLSELGWNEIVITKLGWVSFYAVVMVSPQLLRSIYPIDTPLILVKIVFFITLAAIITVVVTPLSFSERLLRPMQVFTLLLILPILWILFRAYMNRRPGSLVLLPASCVLVLMGVIEIYNSVYGVDQKYSLLGMGVILFSLGASVSQSLNFDRTFHMVERQTRGIHGLNRKLRKQAEFLERRVQHTTEELATLLRNLPEGVLLIEENNRQLRVGSYLSQPIIRILGGEPVTWQVVQNFLAQTNLDSDQRAQLESTLQAMLGDDAISFDLNADNLPQELQKLDDMGIQTYLCAWAPVILDDCIHSILLVLVDVSSERSVYHQFEQDQQIIDRITHLLAIEPDNLSIFMQEAQQIVQRLESVRHDSKPARQTFVLRELHTLKGLARSFGLLSLAKSAHDLEDRVLRQPLSSLDVLLSVWQTHLEAFSTLGLAHSLLPVHEKKEDLLLVCGQQLINGAEPPSEIWQHSWQDYLHSLFVRMDTLVTSLQDGLNSVALQLGKPQPLLVIEGGDVGIRRSAQGKLLGGLNHILRNALDHGLEQGLIRAAQGKSEQGTIFIKVQFREKILIEVHDDGCGFNLQRIYERSIEKGLIQKDQVLSDEQIVQFVFAAGFSTKTLVNDISGRGMGMDAVQTLIHQMGGHIRIVWRSRRNAQGFREGTWCITLPRRYGFHEVPS